MRTEPATWVCTDYEEMESVLKLDWTVKVAIESQSITREEGEKWLAHIKEAGTKEQFFAVIMYLITAGRKPS